MKILYTVFTVEAVRLCPLYNLFKGIDGVEAGTAVTVFGEGMPVEELATTIGTISYELLCLIGKRVPRVFVQDGDVVGVHDAINGEA